MLSRFVLVLIEGASRSRQMFKIIAPFVILASVFATLNARLGLPPFSLFLMALTLTDGECGSYSTTPVVLDVTQSTSVQA